MISLYSFYLFFDFTPFICVLVFYLSLPSLLWIMCCWLTILPTLFLRLVEGFVFLRKGIYLLTGRSSKAFLFKGSMITSQNIVQWLLLIFLLTTIVACFFLENTSSFIINILSSASYFVSSDFSLPRLIDSSCLRRLLGDF